MSEAQQYEAGFAAGEKWAGETGVTAADLNMVPVQAGTRAYQSGFRIGVAKVRNQRARAERPCADELCAHMLSEHDEKGCAVALSRADWCETGEDPDVYCGCTVPYGKP